MSRSNAWPNRRALVQLCRARDLLADVRTANVSIGDAAREAGLSSFHFIRRFEAVFGETPHQFRTRERLTAAQRLLARGHSVTDVCLDVGFSSLGSFSALFARRIGISPARYQRNLRGCVYIPNWTPHPPNCLLWMGGPAAIAIFDKTLRSR
jgi:AraC-like DNA-binding protein